VGVVISSSKQGEGHYFESEQEDPKGSHRRKWVKRMVNPDRSKQYAGKTVAGHNHPNEYTSVVAPTEYASNLIKEEAPEESNLSTFPMESTLNFNHNETAGPLDAVGKLAQNGPIQEHKDRN